MNNLGSQIKKFRQQLGLTMQQLAEACGLASKDVIYQYESGRRNPSMKTLEKLGKVLSFEVEINLKSKKNKKP